MLAVEETFAATSLAVVLRWGRVNVVSTLIRRGRAFEGSVGGGSERDAVVVSGSSALLDQEYPTERGVTMRE